MIEGNHVYHDFPAGNFNIDHIVVGPAGVFAIETKARSKHVSEAMTDNVKVQYTGKAIQFPGYSDTQSLEQAKRQSKWLSNWLKNATGDATFVYSVVSIPGWYVERKVPADGMFVINPKNMKNIIKSNEVIKLSDKKIQQILHQLDMKCRDQELISKQYDYKKMS